jgi:DNA-binding beta-propeller fold protein YncE
MNRKLIAFASLIIILVFIGYIIIDTIQSGNSSYADAEPSPSADEYPDMWSVIQEIPVDNGTLKALAVSSDGKIFTGGDSFVSAYDSAGNKLWSLKTPSGINAISISGDTVFAATAETIFLIDINGNIITEWGPYEAKSIITSVASDNVFVAFADAGNKRIFVLKKDGEVVTMIGQGESKLIIPSPYFDVALSGSGLLYLANTGNRRIETWTTDGRFVDAFGEPGTAPEAFCGCCNPAHFTVIPRGFLTAEKGINRIKILDREGRFVEYVSSVNKFSPSIPLDVASFDGNKIYAANTENSIVYVFRRK